MKLNKYKNFVKMPLFSPLPVFNQTTLLQNSPQSMKRHPGMRGLWTFVVTLHVEAVITPRKGAELGLRTLSPASFEH